MADESGSNVAVIVAVVAVLAIAVIIFLFLSNTGRLGPGNAGRTIDIGITGGGTGGGTTGGEYGGGAQ
jgi:hypothetical protein